MVRWAYFDGGPKGGQVLLGRPSGDLVVFTNVMPRAVYRITERTVATRNHGEIPVAEYVGSRLSPPAA
jgi:hypothetical protein